MAWVYDNTRSSKQGGGWIQRADPNAYIQTELPSLRTAAADRLARSQGRWKTADKFAYAASAVPFAAAAAPLLMGGTPAAAAPAGSSYSSPGIFSGVFGGTGGGTVGVEPAARQGFSIGRLLGSKGAELVAGLGTTLMGNRSAGKAQREANALTERSNAAQMALAQQQYDREQSNLTADRADAERRWQAEEAFRAKTFAADEENRLHTRQLEDEKEARLAPRRELSRQALMRVGQILGWN